MAARDIDLLARKLVTLERQQTATSRATQLALSSVRLLDGSSVAISSGLEDAEGNTEDIGILNDYTNDIADSLDEAIDFNDSVYDWIGSSAEAGEIAWDATEYAVDLANELEIGLAEANADIDQAKLDLATAETELAEARQDITDAKNAAADAVETANNAQASVDGKNTIYYTTPTPESAPDWRVGDTWFDKSIPALGTVIKTWDGSGWVQGAEFGETSILNASITNAKIANLDAAKITTGYLSVNRLEALSITAQKLAADSVTADKIVAGAVVAGKLAADSVVAENIVGGTITGDKLVGLTITGDKIAANAITAGKIQAEAIDGMTITGALIRTAPSGQRMQFDVNGLRTFDASGNMTANLDAAVGGLALEGGSLFVGYQSASTRVPSSDVSTQGIEIQMPYGSGNSYTAAVLNSGYFTVGEYAGHGTGVFTVSGGPNASQRYIRFGVDPEYHDDTNWANFPREAGVTGTARWRRYHGVVYIDVTTTSTVGANNNIRIGTLPAGARPAVLTALPAGASGAQNEIAVASVDTAGVVRAAVRGGAARPVNISGSFLQ